MAKPVSSFRTPGTVWPCHTSIGLVVLRGASEVSICQRWRYHAARSATRELSAARSMVTRVIWRGPEARRADMVAHLSEHSCRWQGCQRFPGEP
jgi:hypothetical protein